jgi:hypothetical protein
MSYEHLCDRLRAQRVQRGSAGQATISVQRGDSPSRRRQFTGRVRIDGQLSGDLVGSEPRVFEVQPGVHTVTVYLGRKDKVHTAPGKAEVSTTFSLGPGERVALSCGVRREAARQWTRVDTSNAINGVGLAIALYAIIICVAWFCSYARVSWWLVGALVIAFAMGLSLGLLGGFALGRMTRTTANSTAEAVKSRIDSPYYLERQPVGKAQAGPGGELDPEFSY